MRWEPSSELKKILDMLKNKDFNPNVSDRYIGLRIDLKTKNFTIHNGNMARISIDDFLNKYEETK